MSIDRDGVLTSFTITIKIQNVFPDYTFENVICKMSNIFSGLLT